MDKIFLKIDSCISKHDITEIKNGNSKNVIGNKKNLSRKLIPNKSKKEINNLYMKMYRYETDGFYKETKSIKNIINLICTHLSVKRKDLISDNNGNDWDKVWFAA